MSLGTSSSQPSRSRRRWIECAWIAGSASLGFASLARAASLPEVTVTTEPNGIRLHVEVPVPSLREVPGTGDVEISIDGWGRSEDVGGPALPMRSLLLGVPEGAQLRLEVTPGPTRFFPGARPSPVPERQIESNGEDVPTQSEIAVKDPALYAIPTSGELASLIGSGRLRHLSVATVQVRPFRWDPTGGGVRMIESFDLVLRWDAPVERARPSAKVSLGADHPSWERSYSSAILNWEQASSFLTSPVAWRGVDSWERSTFGAQPSVRVSVEATGIHRIDQEALPPGWAAGNVRVEQIVLEERDFNDAAENPFFRLDVPILVMDYDEDGFFTAGDAIFFYGQTAWDRLDPAPRDKRFGRRFHYFLTTRAEGGARMAEAGSTLNRTDLTAETRFIASERFEGDGVYMNTRGNDESAHPLTNGMMNILIEHFYWIGGGPAPYSVTFDLPGFVHALGVEMLFQGIINPPNSREGAPILSAGSGESMAALPGVTVGIKDTVRYVQGEDTVGALPLTEANNRLNMDLTEDGYGCALDYMIWTYERNFDAFQDVVRFHTTGLSGARQFDLTGFSNSDLLAFDFSDSSRPIHLTFAEGQVDRPGGRTWRARLQFDLSAEEARELVVLEASAALTPTLALTSERDLRTDPELSGPLDLIVVAHPSFWTPGSKTPVERLADRRRANGLRVGVVTTEEVFDQFGGGRSWPIAIRNYLRYCFRTQDVDPTYLLLVGDGSEDYPQGLAESAPNFVPAPVLFANAFSNDSYQLVASDPWFVDNLTGTGETLDFFLDMHVGRLPVGNTAELDAVVDKILGYEEFRDVDSWRNRGLFMADDEFSSQISFGPDYQWRGDSDRTNPQGGESVFRYAGRESERIIHDEAGFHDFQVDSFYVACFLDTVACLDRCVPVNDPLPPDCLDWQCPTNGGCEVTAFNRGNISLEENQEYTSGAGRVTEKLWAAMSRGHLFVMFQSHANWALATHEYVWRDAPHTGRNDSSQLQNVEKPFLFFGFGCHMAEFSSYREGLGARGDCMSEKMLFLGDGRGAIAACASTGYEWLSANSSYQLALIESWFLDPPKGADGRTQWVLGDLIDSGKLRLMFASSNRDNQGMVATYALLGDPSMPVDLAAPRVDRVEVDGVTWSDGQPLTAAADQDSAEIAVWLRDEVWIRSITVKEDGQIVDPSQYRIEPDPQHPGDDRYAIVRYSARLEVPLEDYEIEIAGVDRVGRARAVSFPVTLVPTFEIQIGEDWQELRPQDFVQPRDSIRVSITSPVDLEAADLALELSRRPLDVVRARSGDDRHWTLFAVIPGDVSDLEQTLAVTVAQRNSEGIARREIVVNGASASADVELLSSFNFPNPFEDETRFFYTLNAPADRARITVFTLRGQKIFSAEGRSRSGENTVLWDGRDEDGDPVANGVYFYKVEVEAPGGRKVTKIDRLARVR